MVAHRDFSHREVVDKLGIKSGDAVAIADDVAKVAPDLPAQILARTGRPPWDGTERVAIAVIAVTSASAAIDALNRWRLRLMPSGGIWLLTPKRGHDGYLDQGRLIEAGLTTGMVDNKVCSVSDGVSAMRFVIRRRDR